jgi:hypothetical protein
MTNLTPAARLKVKGDTFFLPVPNDNVYFRNNVGTFRMKGEMIDWWIEKLIYENGEVRDGAQESKVLARDPGVGRYKLNRSGR